MVVGASVLTGLLTYGTYGYLKDKKRMSSWKAGAITGAITGGVSLLGLIVMGQMGAGSPAAGLGAVASRPLFPDVRLRQRYPSMYKQFGALVVNKLNGCGGCK